MSKSVSLSFVVALSAGSIDREASLKAAADALDAHIAETETAHSTVQAAVEAVFDEHRGAALTMPDLAFFAGIKLNADPKNRKMLEKVTLDYIRANSSAKREDGKLFVTRKGVGGGVSRWSDIPEKTATQASASESTDSDDSAEA